MKFGKEFSSQMVPEWQHLNAYMDYGSLEKFLKQHANALTPGGAKGHHGGGLIRKMTPDCPFSCLTLLIQRRQRLGNSHDVEEGAKSTATKTTTGQIQVETTADGQVQKNVQMLEEGGKHESEFFRRLEAQLDKVKKFYEETVAKVLEEEAELSKKLETFTPCTPAGTKSIGSEAHTVIVEEGESSRDGQLEDEAPPSYTTEALTSNNNRGNSKDLKSNKKNSSKMKDLKHDYVRLYRKLLNLQNYSFSNAKAFSKILKKYDKIFSMEKRKLYMKKVDSSFLVDSDKVVPLTKRVKEDFIKHFAADNRTKGMKILRPKMTRERHRLTFSTGFAAGCVFSLIVALVSIIRTRNILHNDGQDVYMNTMFPLYSWFGFVMLHILMYAVNIYFWRRYRVNYSKIFELKEGTELGHRQVLLVAFSIGVFALLCVLANLHMEVDPRTKHYPALTELLPLFLLIGIFGVLYLPFNFLYGPKRKFYLTCLFHCIAAPFYKVSFADSFLGAQFTSQVQALRSFEFYICYYGWGDFTHRENTCNKSSVYNTFLFIVVVIPFVSRFLQCLRRLVDDKKLDHRWNGLKYFLTIVAVCFRTAYSIQPDRIAWRVLAIIFSAVAAIFGTYWDFIHDWGLLNRTSKNRWLRNNLLIPQKEVYFIAMVLNVLLRFAWIQTVLAFNLPFRHSKQTMVVVVASLEIIRRGIWNFFRLENEHLKNVEKESPTSNGGDKGLVV